jgi:hypothetical protein
MAVKPTVLEESQMISFISQSYPDGQLPINALVLSGLANFGLVGYTESPTYDP